MIIEIDIDEHLHEASSDCLMEELEGRDVYFCQENLKELFNLYRENREKFNKKMEEIFYERLGRIAQ